MEMGVGIHGEPGRARKPFASANEIVDEMVEAIVTDRKPTADGGTADPIFNSGDEVALMVNGLGGTPISELYLLYGRSHEQVEKRGLKVWRSYVGEYCTALEMNGMSVTLWSSYESFHFAKSDSERRATMPSTRSFDSFASCRPSMAVKRRPSNTSVPSSNSSAR